MHKILAALAALLVLAPAARAQSLDVAASFNGTDGANPEAGLIDVSGTLYGTASDGGANGDGTLFSYSAANGLTTLASFNGANGANPLAGLTAVNNTLYGTTVNGGANIAGVLFSYQLPNAAVPEPASIALLATGAALLALGRRRGRSGAFQGLSPAARADDPGRGDR